MVTRALLLEGMAKGWWINAATGSIQADPPDLADVLMEWEPGQAAPKNRRLDADLLRSVLVGQAGARKAGAPSCDPRGLRIAGAVIDQPVDLSEATIGFQIALVASHTTGLILAGAHLRNLILTQDFLHGQGVGAMAGVGLLAERLRTTSSVNLRGTWTTGAVRLLSAEIGGQLSLDGAKLGAGTTGDMEGISLHADNLKTTSNVSFRGTETAGAVRLSGAQIGGQLSLDGAGLGAGTSGDMEGVSLHADDLKTTGNMFFRGTETAGAVRLSGAQIGGQLSVNGARLGAGTIGDVEGVSVHADNLIATTHVFLKARTSGLVSLAAAQIGGQLSLDGAELGVGTAGETKGVSLVADRLRTGDSAFLRGTKTVGAVRFLSAQIEGQWILDGAELGVGTTGEARGVSLVADRLRTGDSAFLRGTKTTGAARLSGAKINGQLCLDGADLGVGTNQETEGVSLLGHRLEADENVFLRHVRTVGSVSLVAAQIGGQFVLDGATLGVAASGPNARVSLAAQSLSVVDSFTLRPAGIAGMIDLTTARIGVLVTPRGRSARRRTGSDELGLASVGATRLEDLRLGSAAGWQITTIHGALATDAAAARAFLSQQQAIQPWFAVAEALDSAGEAAKARRLRFRGIRASRGRWNPGWLLTGYGYYPAAAAAWIALCLTGLFFSVDAAAANFTTASTPAIRADLNARATVATDPVTRRALRTEANPDLTGRVRDRYCSSAWDTGCFNPTGYTLSAALLPTNLNSSTWTPPDHTPFLLLLYCLRIAIWALTTLLLAALTGILKRRP
jgi:hypothetical protein